jgi:Fic family protein
MPRVFEAPSLEAVDLELLRTIDDLRGDMRHRVGEPRRWVGSLRRVTLARAVQGSNSIEGYNASLEDVAAAVDGEPTLAASIETQHAIAGYRDAMTYVLQLAHEDVRIDEGLVKSLHFMMLKHDLPKWPGRWRPGYIAVEREADGEIVYEGPDFEQVPALVAAMTEQLAEDDGPVLVRAAMAHMNLAMIHPFRDGNGRMARCLQTLVLAREKIVAPVFSSIEEYLGRNTQAYYDVLGLVGQGAWNPDRSALPWVRFCLTAHYRQAKTHLRRIEEIEQVWNGCAELATQAALPERTTAGLLDAALGLRLRRGSYRAVVQAAAGEEISDITATRDLKAMVDSGLLEPVGERRARYYLGDARLRELRTRVRAARPAKDDDDPYAVSRAEPRRSVDGP